MTGKNRILTSSVKVGVRLSPGQQLQIDDSAFRILIIGNLGAVTPFHAPVLVDRDDLDQVIAELQVCTRVQRSESDPAIEIQFREFDDFHPDRLFNRLGIFESLRTRRQRLQNDATCQEEIAAILKANTADSKEQISDSAGTGQPDKSTPNVKELLSDVLNITQSSQKSLEQQVLDGVFDWDTYVRQLVAYMVDKADPRQAELIAGVDSVVAETMRSILHNSSFQQLEATWQGIRFLTQRLETGRNLQLSVMHLPMEDLEADLLAEDDLTRTKLYKLLKDDVSAEGADPWSLVVGDFQFRNSPAACEMLARLAKICEAAGTIFASGVAPGIAGCEDFARSATPAETIDPRDWTSPGEEEMRRWNNIRNHTPAQHIILSLPKLMARRPYGPESDPVESFVFCEIPDGTHRADYLWMNAAFGIAALLGQDHAQDIPTELERLPLYVFEHEGEELLQPGTEVALSQRAAEKFAEFGLTVFRAVRNEETVRVAMVRTLSGCEMSLPETQDR